MPVPDLDCNIRLNADVKPHHDETLQGAIHLWYQILSPSSDFEAVCHKATLNECICMDAIPISWYGIESYLRPLLFYDQRTRLRMQHHTEFIWMLKYSHPETPQRYLLNGTLGVKLQPP